MEPYELRRGPYKNLTLRLIPPNGALRVTAPWLLPQHVVDRFVTERSAWIDQKRRQMGTPLEEAWPSALWVWGVAHRLRVESVARRPAVLWNREQSEVVLRVAEGATVAQRRLALDRWERERVRAALDELVPLWSERTGLGVAAWTVKTLRSRWGSCRPDARRLVLNGRLGAFPPHCLEHVLVHELAHLLEPRHNARFHTLVEGWLPGSVEVRRLLRSGMGPVDLTSPNARAVSPDAPATTEAGRAP